MKNGLKFLPARLCAGAASAALCAAVSAAAAGGFGPAEYLLEGFGARAAGMGEAQTAAVSGAYAAYWNPAGLAGQQNGCGEFGGQYSLLSHDRWLNYFGCAFGLESCGLGLSWINFANGRIKAWTDEGLPAGEFSSAENTWVVAAAGRVSDNLNLGLGVKLFHQAFAGLTALGCGLDFSGQGCFLPGRALRLGFNLQNTGAFLRASTGHCDQGPARLKVGAAWQGLWDARTRLAGLQITADAVWIPGYPWEGHAGAEYCAFRTPAEEQGRPAPGHGFFLRAGCDRGRPTCGAGYASSACAFDYALVLDPGGVEAWNVSHRISLTVGWQRLAEAGIKAHGLQARAGQNVPESGRPFDGIVQTYCLEAGQLRDQGKDQEAVLVLEQALALDPQQPQVKDMLRAARERILEQTPLPQALEGTGTTRPAETWDQHLRASGRNKRAAAGPHARKKRRSSRTGAADGRDEYAAGAAAFRSQDFARALELWGALAKHKPDDDNLRQAIAMAQKARQQQLAAAEEHYLQGLQCYQQGKSAEARMHWKQTLRLNSQHTRALKCLRKIE